MSGNDICTAMELGKTLALPVWCRASFIEIEADVSLFQAADAHFSWYSRVGFFYKCREQRWEPAICSWEEKGRSLQMQYSWFGIPLTFCQEHQCIPPRFCWMKGGSKLNQIIIVFVIKWHNITSEVVWIISWLFFMITCSDVYTEMSQSITTTSNYFTFKVVACFTKLL